MSTTNLAGDRQPVLQVYDSRMALLSPRRPRVGLPPGTEASTVRSLRGGGDSSENDGQRDTGNPSR